MKTIFDTARSVLPAKILLIQLEFEKWRDAAHWSYTNQLAIEEGLKANGITPLTLTSPWMKRFDQIVRCQKFDQIWIEIVHQKLDEPFLEKISKLAPLRVGLIAESLQHTSEDYRINPALKSRKQQVQSRLKYLTHAVACDEADVEEINKGHAISAFWWAPAIPKRFILNNATLKEKHKKAIFSGAVYGKREHFITAPELKGLLEVRSFQDGMLNPLLFDALHFFVKCSRKLNLPGTCVQLSIYLKLLRRIRQQIFRRFLNSMGKSCAVVNLPSILKAYPARVIDGMAAGRPVITWRIPDRPRTQGLFRNDQEILFFDGTKPKQLAEQIERINTEEGLAASLVRNAQDKVLRYHTIEKRVEEILQWIMTGKIPTYE